MRIDSEIETGISVRLEMALEMIKEHKFGTKLRTESRIGREMGMGIENSYSD